MALKSETNKSMGMIKTENETIVFRHMQGLLVILPFYIEPVRQIKHATTLQ